MWLSILGMYNYDNTIFDGLTVPEGLDKQKVIDNILLNCAELEILYSRIETMKTAITAWSYSNQFQWERLYNIYKLEYNPLWNVDATIEETENGARVIDRDNAFNSTNNESIDLEDKKSVKGFNETGWAESEKNDRTGTDNTAITGTESEDVKENTQNTRSTRRTGNIGVTSNVDLITQERDFWQTFNLIDYITESFKNRFCLLIY